MSDPNVTIEEAMAQVERLRRNLRKNKQPQVRAREEQLAVKATSLAWFNNHRPVLVSVCGNESLAETDNLYQQLLGSAQRNTSRSVYDLLLKQVRHGLVELQSQSITNLAAAGAAPQTSDRAPDFSPLISDPEMQEILKRRWEECVTCIGAGVSLAATVMMGGLLEALLMARVNREANKAPIFTASNAPKDKSSNKVLPLKEWTLRHYIDVGHELSWISQSAKAVGEVLRDYRNYIHPYKELSHGVHLERKDAVLFWEISKSISRQVIDSSK